MSVLDFDSATCTWPLLGCDPASGCADLASLDATVRAAVEDMAVEMLWRWTGRQFGLCEHTVRPCRRDCAGATVPWGPALIGGHWLNLTCGSCSGTCSCRSLSEAVLPAPVAEITEVLLDGAPMASGGYRVDDYRLLVRTDGGTWPSCQRLDLPATADGTWQVTFLQGRAVPPGGQLAAGTLACELAKAHCGSGDCRLPRRVQTITREGVTVGFLDTFDGLAEGHTGLWEVDGWVASLRRSPQGGAVHTPDVARGRITTWP